MIGGDQDGARRAVRAGRIQQKTRAHGSRAVAVRLVDLDRRTDHGHGQVSGRTRHGLRRLGGGRRQGLEVEHQGKAPFPAFLHLTPPWATHKVRVRTRGPNR